MPLILHAALYFSKLVLPMVHSFLSTSLPKGSPVSTAQGWSTIEKEGFIYYHGIKSNDYLLRGKEFILETDHNNLVWIKTSEVPKIIR